MEPLELISTYHHYKSLEEFFFQFVESIVVVDPLDREITGAYDENQAIPVAELIKNLENLKPVNGSMLQIPLGDQEYRHLKDLFNVGFYQVAREGEKFLEQYKT